MKKRAAKKFAMEDSKLTFQDLKDIVNSVKDLSGLSLINNELPREYLFNNIFKPYFKMLEDKNTDMNAIVKTTYLNVRGRTDKIQISSDGMILINIIRECEYQEPK